MKQIKPNAYLESGYNNILLSSINSKFHHNLLLHNELDKKYLNHKALKKINRIYFDIIKYFSSSNYLILLGK
jgi:hypothetical protein